MKNLRDGTTIELLGGSLKDTSGNGFHPTVINNVTIASDSKGRLNRALNFDYNTGQPQEYLDFGDVADLEDSDFVIKARIYIDVDIDQYSTIMSKYSSSSDRGWIFYYRPAANELAFLYSLDGTSQIVFNVPVTIEADTLYTFLVTRLDATLYIYLDGVLLNTYNIGTGVSIYQTTTTIRTGTYFWSNVTYIHNINGGSIDGRLEELKLIIGQGYTSEQVTQDFLNIKGNYQGLFDGLTAGYDFKGDALDFTTDDNDGVVTGPTLTADRFDVEESAYQFTTDITDIITMPASTNYSFPGDFIVAFVFSSALNAANNHILGTGWLDGAWSGGWGVYTFSDGRLGFGKTGVNGVNTLAGIILPDTTHGVVITRIGSTLYTYVDGVLRYSGTYTSTFLTSLELHIGSFNAAGGALNGKVENLFIFNDSSWTQDKATLFHDLITKKNIHIYLRGNE